MLVAELPNMASILNAPSLMWRLPTNKHLGISALTGPDYAGRSPRGDTFLLLNGCIIWLSGSLRFGLICTECAFHGQEGTTRIISWQFPYCSRQDVLVSATSLHSYSYWHPGTRWPKCGDVRLPLMTRPLLMVLELLEAISFSMLSW
jgi:hypothetical protein